MKSRFLFSLLIGFLFLFTNCKKSENTLVENWQLKPFVKADSANPVLEAVDSTSFLCPVRNELVYWESKDVFNPATVVKDGKIYMFYRAEDHVGKFNGTSRIGIAVSHDGIHFKREPKPVFYPENDSLKMLEWEGGCEDPRIVEDENGIYYMTYSAYDGQTARLLVASSKDLYSWEKHGSVFKECRSGEYADLWSKSGSIVCRLENGRFVATKINGKYWMYFGDTSIFLAWSDDLLNWVPLESKDTKEPLPVLKPRKNKFDSGLVEPGPPAIITSKGILLIYNSRNNETEGDQDLPVGTYAAGQALFNSSHPEELTARSENHFIKPDKDYEITGQVNNVCFVEGLSFFNNKWFLYYGTADSKIAVAISQSEIN